VSGLLSVLVRGDQSVLLPPLHQLQSHLAELLQNWASTVRLWELARRHRPEGGSEDKPAEMRTHDGENETLDRPLLDRERLEASFN